MLVEAAKTPEQITQIEAHLKSIVQYGAKSSIYFDIWKFGINVALRIDDLLKLTMADIEALDPEQRLLTICEGKTGKVRKIKLNGTAFEIARRRHRDNPKHVYLFQSESRTLSRRKPPQAITQRSVLRVFESVGSKIKPAVKLGTHSMRKTRGYSLHSAGVSIELIAKMLNHSTPAVTMRYIGLTQEDVDSTYTEFEL